MSSKKYQQHILRDLPDIGAVVSNYKHLYKRPPIITEMRKI
jgi:hypothetical protein